MSYEHIQIRQGSLNEVGAFFRQADDQGSAALSGDRIQHCNEFYIAEFDGQIVGALAAATSGCGHSGPSLAAILVHPECRQLGIGRALCEAGIRSLVSEGKSSVFCDVTSRNMHKVLDSLPPDLRRHVDATLSYLTLGDEWEEWKEFRREQRGL